MGEATRLADALNGIGCVGERPEQDAEGRVAWRAQDARSLATPEKQVTIQFQWPTIIGIAGTLMVLLAFFLLQVRKLHGNGAIYQLLNAFGAAAIIVSLFHAFNLASMVLEIAWLLISIHGLVVSFRHRRDMREPAAPAWSDDGPSRARKGPR